jgi:hypothetical protein
MSAFPGARFPRFTRAFARASHYRRDLLHGDPINPAREDCPLHPIAKTGCDQGLYLLFPHLDGLEVDRVQDAGNGVLITARSRAAEAACHRCGLSSAQVNSRYRRRLDDLAAGGRPVMIDLEVRRFFCSSPQCKLRRAGHPPPPVDTPRRHLHALCATAKIRASLTRRARQRPDRSWRERFPPGSG